VIGKPVTFKVDYVLENVPGRVFGSVFVGTENIALTVVSNGWAKVTALLGCSNPVYQQQ
jgi:endonuclease YncB( thermonuclease family)